MGYEPVTYCRQCYEPFDVYRAPDDRVCDDCAQHIERAELGVNGNCGFALLGQDLQVGEAEFEEIVGTELNPDPASGGAKCQAISRAFRRLKARIGKPISYYLGPSHPHFLG